MNEAQKALVKATIPVLQENGVALTAYFYNRMLTHNPELKNIFNQAHQSQGDQPKALAGAVLAYAQNIDDPSVLLPVVERIAHKHTSLGIRAEQYAIVGKHLLASIQEVLGEAATPELVDAWANAYQELADLFIDVESKLYQTSINEHKGWTGWRPFKIEKKVQESELITSFYLSPCDQGELPSYQPGQYISVRVFIPETGLYQPRQYSLSQAPNSEYLRISVKKELALESKPEGCISNQLHDKHQVGDVIEVSAPYGEFFLDTQTDKPVVLISGGVGITPMMAMSESLHQQGKAPQVHFIHSARNAKVHAFKSITDGFAKDGMRVDYFYDSGEEAGVGAAPFALAQLLGDAPQAAQYYICGPIAFMTHYIQALKDLGVAEAQIHAEAFGSGGV